LGEEGDRGAIGCTQYRVGGKRNTPYKDTRQYGVSLTAVCGQLQKKKGGEISKLGKRKI